MIPKNRGKKKILIEVVAMYAAAVLPVALLYPVRGAPFISTFIWPVALALQIYLPVWLYLHRNWNLSTLGLHFVNWRRSLRDALVAALLLFPPSIAGHHYWQKWLGRELYVSSLALRQLPYSLRSHGQEGAKRSGKRVSITAEPDRPVLNFSARGDGLFFRLIAKNGHLLFLGGNVSLSGPPIAKVLELKGNSPELFFRVRTEAERVSVEIWRGERLLQSGEIGLGPGNRPPASNPFSIERDYWWLLYLLIVQIFLVALPEELFYRGYILHRLDKIFPQRIPLPFSGLYITWGNVLTSALFALTHLLIGFSPHRLGVFFPSLIFGILRQRGGTLVGAVIFHAFSNILIKTLEYFYM